MPSGLIRVFGLKCLAFYRDPVDAGVSFPIIAHHEKAMSNAPVAQLDRASAF